MSTAQEKLRKRMEEIKAKKLEGSPSQLPTIDIQKPVLTPVAELPPIVKEEPIQIAPVQVNTPLKLDLTQLAPQEPQESSPSRISPRFNDKDALRKKMDEIQKKREEEQQIKEQELEKTVPIVQEIVTEVVVGIEMQREVEPVVAIETPVVNTVIEAEIVPENPVTPPRNRFSIRAVKKPMESIPYVQEEQISPRISPRKEQSFTPQRSNVVLPISEFKSLEKKSDSPRISPLIRSGSSIRNIQSALQHSSSPRQPVHLDGPVNVIHEIPCLADETVTFYENFYFIMKNQPVLSPETASEILEVALKRERMQMAHEASSGIIIEEPTYVLESNELDTVSDEFLACSNGWKTYNSAWDDHEVSISAALDHIAKNPALVDKPGPELMRNGLVVKVKKNKEGKQKLDGQKSQEGGVFTPLVNLFTPKAVVEEVSLSAQLDKDLKKEFATWMTILSDKGKKRWCQLKGAYILIYDTEKSTKESANILLQAGQIENLSPEVSMKETQQKNVIKVHGKKIAYLQPESFDEFISWGNAMRKGALRYTGATIVVDATGANKAEKTIGNALLKAQPLDRIVITSGTYIESLIVTKPVSLEGGKDVIVQSPSTSALTVNVVGSVKMTQIVFETASENDAVSCVVLKGGCLTLSACDVKGGRESAVKALSTTQLTLYKCSIKGSKSHGVFLKGLSMATIEGSLISGNGGDGIYLALQSILYLRLTSVTGNEGNGLHVNGESSIVLEGSRFARNKLSGIVTPNPKTTVIANNNEIYDNGGHGIYSGEGNDHIQISSTNRIERNGNE